MEKIVTKAELATGGWLDSVKMMDNEATEEEYTRIVSLLLGSGFVTYSNQVYSHVDKTVTRILGDKKEHGLGGVMLENQEPPVFDDLQGLPLGHPLSILFWNQNLCKIFKNKTHTLVGGDHACGKTTSLVSGALTDAGTGSGETVFIPGISHSLEARYKQEVDYLLDIAIRLKFTGTGVIVKTMHDLRTQLGLPLTATFGQILHQFVESLDHKEETKLYVDELPVSQNDLEKMKSHAESSLSQTLSSCARTGKSVLALRTDNMQISPAELSDYVSHTHTFIQLSHTLRTSSSIRRACIQNLKEYSHGPLSEDPDDVFIASTVHGSKPWCILAPWSGYADYPVIGSGIETALGLLQYQPEQQLVILCDHGIDPREVASMVPLPTHTYTGGVETYDMSGVATHCPLSPSQRDEEVGGAEEWLDKRGVLVTHGELFKGMECPSVIWVTRNMGASRKGRSSMMSAVARLVVLTDSNHVNTQAVKTHFTVVEGGAYAPQLLPQLPKAVLGEKVDELIPHLNVPSKTLLTELLECLEAASMESLLQTISGVEKAITMMVIHLCCPELRTECQLISDIPLAGFRSIERIKQYSESIIQFGLSKEMRGRVFILGNTGTGKSSLALTLKNDERFLTGDKGNEHLLATKVLEVIPDLKFKTKIHHFQEKCDAGCITISPKEASQQVEESELNISVYDFGGHQEYFLGSKIYFTDNGVYMIMFDSTKISPETLTPSIGCYIDLVLQNADNPVICLVASKNDKGEKTAKDFTYVTDYAEKYIKFLTEGHEEENKKAYLLGEVLVTSSEVPDEKWLTWMKEMITSILTNKVFIKNQKGLIPLIWNMFLKHMKSSEKRELSIAEVEDMFERVKQEAPPADFKVESQLEAIKKLHEVLAKSEDILCQTQTIMPLKEQKEQKEQKEHKSPVKEEKDKEKVPEVESDMEESDLEEEVKETESDMEEEFKEKESDVEEEVKETESNDEGTAKYESETEGVIDFFANVGEILWFSKIKDLKEKVFAHPMDLIKKCRCIINHETIGRVRMSADDGFDEDWDPDDSESLDAQDLEKSELRKGVIQSSRFKKLCEKEKENEDEIRKYLQLFQLAFKWENDLFIPCLVSGEENEVDENTFHSSLEILVSSSNFPVGKIEKLLGSLKQQNQGVSVDKIFCQKIENRKPGVMFAVECSVEIDKFRQKFILIEETRQNLFNHDQEISQGSFPKKKVVRLIMETGRGHGLDKILAYFNQELLGQIVSQHTEQWVRLKPDHETRKYQKTEDIGILSIVDMLKNLNIFTSERMSTNEKYVKNPSLLLKSNASYEEFRNEDTICKAAISFHLIGNIESSRHHEVQDVVRSKLELKETCSYQNQGSKSGDLSSAFIGNSSLNSETRFFSRYFVTAEELTCLVEMNSSDDKNLVEAADYLDQVMEDFAKQKKVFLERKVACVTCLKELPYISETKLGDIFLTDLDDRQKISCIKKSHNDSAQKILEDLKERGNFKNFVKFEITHEETVILDGAVKIKCIGENNHLKARTRTLRHNDFVFFTAYAKRNGMFLIGTPFELEVQDPSSSFPKEGVSVSVRHMLQVPALPMFSVDTPTDKHMVIKLVEDEENHHIVCEEWKVDSSYLTFTETKSFCKCGIVGLYGWNCQHKFPKTFVISQHKDRCREEPDKDCSDDEKAYPMRLWCISTSENVRDSLADKLSNISHTSNYSDCQIEDSFTSPDKVCKARIKDGSNWKPINNVKNKLSQDLICEKNGVIDMGYIEIKKTCLPAAMRIGLLSELDLEGNFFEEVIDLGDCSGKCKNNHEPKECKCICEKCKPTLACSTSECDVSGAILAKHGEKRKRSPSPTHEGPSKSPYIVAVAENVHLTYAPNSSIVGHHEITNHIKIEIEKLVQNFGSEELRAHITDDQKKFLEKVEHQTNLSYLPGFKRSITKIGSVLNSVCLISWKDSQGKHCTATGFLTKLLPSGKVVFMSAGHNFIETEQNNEKVNKPPCFDFKRYDLTFGNTEGDVNAKEEDLKKKCTLDDLGPFTGSIALNGERYIFPRVKKWSGVAREDYCFLILTDPGKIKPLKEEVLLTCGGEKTDYIQDKDVLSIFGHPSAWDGPNKDLLPLRVSWGLQTGKPKQRIVYDCDTLPGNSGSPVLGRVNKCQSCNSKQASKQDCQDCLKYTVKGIHVAGDMKEANEAQNFNNMAAWAKEPDTSRKKARRN
jgi:GTPase SAR1 family protein